MRDLERGRKAKTAQFNFSTASPMILAASS
jgi:hypothetical protein